MAAYKSVALRPHARSEEYKQKPVLDTMPEEAQVYFRQALSEHLTRAKIVKGLNEKYGVKISKTRMDDYLRRESDLIEIGKQRVRQVREWSQSLVDANASAGGGLDTNKILRDLIQGDVLQFVSTNQEMMQEKAGDLTLDRLADITIKMARVNIENERLTLQKKASDLFQGLEEKNKKREQNKISDTTIDTTPPPDELTAALGSLVQQFGQEQMKAALIGSGIIPPARSSQGGLDPETLRTIREDVYGIFK